MKEIFNITYLGLFPVGKRPSGKGMGINMKRAKSVCAGMICAATILSGCGSAIPDMTEEQTMIISEYAAGLLLKYDKNYNARVVDTTAYHEKLAEEQAEAQKQQEEALQEETAQEQESAAQTGTKETEQTIASLEELCQLEGIQIRYSDYGVYNSYPEAMEEDLFFSLGATDGNKLLVLFFDVTNVSGTDMELNMSDAALRFKVSVNGNANKNALFTLLPDELSEYKGTIGADQTVRTVIVAEIPSGESEALDSIVLTAKSGTQSAQFTLQ